MESFEFVFTEEDSKRTDEFYKKVWLETLRKVMRDIKVDGEIIISDYFTNAKTLHIDPPIDPKIIRMYEERKDNG